MQLNWQVKTGLSIAVLLCAFALGLWWGYQPNTKTNNTSVSETTKKPLYWIDPMEPTVHYPGPGKSHMGMELIPVYPDQQKNNTEHSITITPAVEANIGVRTALVTESNLSREIKTVGYVQANENNITHIHAYAEGWVKELTAKYVGAAVKKGDVLYQFYSPNLINVEEEYLLALRNGDANLISASQKKLVAFNISPQQIQEITKTKKSDPLITVYAPQDGVITVLNVRDGMWIKPDTIVMELLDLSSVWIIADVFESQMAWVLVGQPVTATFDTFPGKTWQGNVDYIYPEVDPTTRTVKVRLRFNNNDLLLKPNMFANLTIYADAKQHALSIPQAAIIPSGEANYVVVSLGQGRYEPRQVVIGIEAGNRVEILSGLQKDEKVVVSGQFLLDSEANLKAGLERLDSRGNNPHDHQHH